MSRKALLITLVALGFIVALVVLFEVEAFSDSTPRQAQPVPQATETPEVEAEEGESVAEILERRRREDRDQEKRLREEMLARAKARWAASQEEAEKRPPVKRRKVRRFVWNSAPESLGESLNVPEEEGEQAVLSAFLRICIAEADGSPQDCVGIWQVMKNIRRRGCERAAVRKITECDERGETILSVMRRAQPHILKAKGYELRNARAGWIRNLETDCEMPEGYMAYLRRGNKTVTEETALNRWDGQYGSNRCPYAVQLGKALIAGDPLVKVSRPGHRLEWLPGRPITWGGRCETKKASCDDRIACARGLARIESPTHNAFWRRPRTPEEVDPVCKRMGYGHLVESVTAAETEEEPSEEQPELDQSELDQSSDQAASDQAEERPAESDGETQG